MYCSKSHRPKKSILRTLELLSTTSTNVNVVDKKTECTGKRQAKVQLCTLPFVLFSRWKICSKASFIFCSFLFREWRTRGMRGVRCNECAAAVVDSAADMRCKR